MKQTIDLDQWNDLPARAQRKLRTWWQPQQGDLVVDRDFSVVLCVNGEGGTFEDDGTRWDVDKKTCIPLFSIRRLLEFLEEHDRIPLDEADPDGASKGIWWASELEPVDVLWQNTVEVLLE